MARTLYPMLQEVEAELVARARSGDPAAWEALVREFQTPLYSFLVHRAPNRSLADDAFQDTFLKAVERIGQFDAERGRFGAWLNGIGLNELRQRLRRDARTPDATPRTRDEEPDPDLHARVNLTITELPARYQRALTLKYQEGRSLQEVATALETTTTAVGSLLHRARAAFREAYQRLGRTS